MGEAELSLLTLETLAAQGAQETGAYLRGRPCDPRFCYELFRRALQEGSAGAWDALVQIYTPLVGAWVTHHPRYAQAHETADFLVNGAFARLAQHMTPEKFQYARDLAAILHYLKLCTHSEVEDCVERLSFTDPGPDQDPFDQRRAEALKSLSDLPERASDASAFWQWIETRLHTAQERRVVAGLFRLGLKPKELYAEFPGEFRDMREVYRISENIIERLRRDPQIGQWIADYL